MRDSDPVVLPQPHICSRYAVGYSIGGDPARGSRIVLFFCSEDNPVVFWICDDVQIAHESKRRHNTFWRPSNVGYFGEWRASTNMLIVDQ